jgi:hypothetical protein
VRLWIVFLIQTVAYLLKMGSAENVGFRIHSFQPIQWRFALWPRRSRPNGDSKFVALLDVQHITNSECTSF